MEVGVKDKLKAKVWDVTHVDFGLLLSVTPSIYHFFISINATTASLRAQLTLECCKLSKRIKSINQWISVFNKGRGFYFYFSPFSGIRELLFLFMVMRILI